MTREERLELLKQIEKDIHVCSLESTLLDDAKSCAIHSAINELEQETVSKESYDREYFLRKELELKVAKLEKQIAEQEPTTKKNIAQERYQDLIDYFGDEELAKIILENKKEFKKWLERIRWQRKRADECARELDLWERFKPNDFKWFQKYLILFNKLIQVRDGIENQVKFWSLPSKRTDELVLNVRKAKAQSYKYCLEDLDKLIEGEKK